MTGKFPDEEKRKEFGQRAHEDFINNEYHLYSTTYGILELLLLIGDRVMVYGRKPALED
jgi:hypothetical protein